MARSLELPGVWCSNIQQGLLLASSEDKSPHILYQEKSQRVWTEVWNCFSFSVRKKNSSTAYSTNIWLCRCHVFTVTASKTNLNILNTVYNKLCRFILGCPFTTHHCTMYENLQFPSLTVRRQCHWTQLIFKCIHFNYPQYLKQFLVPPTTNYQQRHSTQPYFLYVYCFCLLTYLLIYWTNDPPPRYIKPVYCYTLFCSVFLFCAVLFFFFYLSMFRVFDS